MAYYQPLAASTRTDQRPAPQIFPQHQTGPSDDLPISSFDLLQDYGTRPAIIDENGGEWTYRRFVAAADDLALSIGTRRRLVAVAAENRIVSLLAYVGARRAGHPVLLLGGGAGDDSLITRFSVDHLHRAGESEGFVQIGDHRTILHPELAVLLTTSGSTGTPKLVRLSRRNVDSNAHAIADYLGFAPAERAITTLPFNYSYGLSVINSHLATGHCVILNDLSVADPVFWQTFDDRCATSFAGVPYSFELLSRSGFLDRAPPASLRYFTQAGGKLAPDLVRAFAEFAQAHRPRFYLMYGQTEASPRIAYVPPELVHVHPTAIGFPIPGGTIDLVDEHGGLIEDPGIEGELVYRGPNVMMGYASTTEDLARDHELGELRTGDLATRDDLGLITITGRKSRFVKLYGLRVGLDDIEAMLRGHGLSVIAAGDDRQIRLLVDQNDRADEAVTLVRERYGLPATAVRTVCLPSVPRLPSGKVDYASITAFAAAEERPGAPADRSSLVSEIAELLDIPADPTATFAESSADSLNFVRVSLLIEERLGYVPDGWEEIPFGELGAMPSRQAAQERPSRGLTFLSNLRGSLMLLGIPYHAAMAYSPAKWIVKANTTSATASWLAEVSHTFRMPAFFLIAGFFAMMLARSREPGQWLKERMAALVPPLLVAMFLVNPMIMLGRALVAHGGSGWEAAWTEELSRPGPHWIEHAWFLIFLIIYSVGLTIYRRRASFAEQDRVEAVRWTLASSGNLLKFALMAALFVTASVFVLRALHINFMFAEMLWTTSMVSLAPMFLLGCMLASERDALERFATVDRLSVIVAAVSVAALAVVQEHSGSLYRGLTFFLIPIAGIFASRLLLHAFRRWLSSSGTFLAMMTDASLTIYLVHQVFVVFLIGAFNAIALPPIMEIGIISLVALLLSMLVHWAMKKLRSRGRDVGQFGSLRVRPGRSG